MTFNFDMRAAIASSLVGLALFSLRPAEAGPRVGNGGGAWVCQNTSGEFRWLRLVDLFEAENEYALKIAPLGGSTAGNDPWSLLQERFDFVFKSVPQLAPVLVMGPEQLRSVVQMVPKYTELTRINDDQVRVRPGPETCPHGALYYGQLANYTFDGRLLIASDLWADESFSNLDRAALLMHELVYKSLRDKFGDKNSSRARAIVALLFSDLDGSHIGAGVARILTEPISNNLPSPILQKAYKLVCVAHIESESATTVPGELAYLAATNTPNQMAVTLQGFSFAVVTKNDSQFPLSLTIEDLQSGILTASDPDSLNATFGRDGKVALSLERTETQQVVMLECRAVPLK
jgi:hypothetical protein